MLTGFWRGLTTSMISIDAHRDIQGLVFSRYRHLLKSLYMFIHFDDRSEAQLWLREMIPAITAAAWTENEVVIKPDVGINVALTYQGLKVLAPPSLDGLPAEFIAGMADPERSRRLGDI